MEKSPLVYDIAPNNKNINTNQENMLQQPKQQIPDSEKDPNWFCWNIRYISTFYNRPYIPSAFNAQNTPSTSTNATYTSQIYPVNDMINNIMYLQGKQPNLKYNHLVQDVTTSNLQAGWVKGQKVGQLVDYAVGAIRSRVTNAAFSVRSMSKNAVTLRAEMIDKLTFKAEHPEMLPDYQQQGVEFNPVNGFNPKSAEEAEDYVTQHVKDYASDLATDMANGIWVSNNWTQKAIEGFRMGVMATGCVGIEHYVENGRQYQELHPSYNLILDLRHDEDYNRKARFVGVLRLLTPDEIFRRYPYFTKEQQEEVYKMGRNNASFAPYNMPAFNFTWWNYAGSTYSPLITCVTGYWITRENLGKKKVKNKFGTEKINNVGTGEVGDDWVDSVCKGTMIGNKYLTDYGYVTNMVEDFNDKSKPRMPLLVYTPNLMLGELRAPVGKIKDMQNDRDMLRYKITETIGRAKGKAHVFLTNKATAKDITEDLASMGLTVIPPETGEPGDNTRQSLRISESLDFTLDPNIQLLFQYYDRIGNEMEEILNTSKIALGQQQSYIGYSTQQSTIAQSTLGMSPLLDGYMDFIQMNMQYSINQAKYLYTVSDNEQADFIVGQKGVKFLEVTKDFRFEDLLVELKINDFIEQQQKQYIMNAANIALQAQAIDMQDYVELDMSQTYSQIRKWLVESMAKKKEEAAAQNAMNALMAQINNAKNNQTQENIANITQHGATDRTAMITQADLVKHATDHAMAEPAQAE